MLRWKRALLLGFLSWLIPFLLAFPIFPLKRANAPLFATVMTLVVVLTAGILLQVYYRDLVVEVSKAVLVGFLWFAMNLIFDYPMFAYGPMKMTAAAYYSEIGASYLIYPAFALGAAWLARSQRQKAGLG